MSTVKIIELSGASSSSWEDAVESAVATAAKTVKNLICVDVQGWTGNIDADGKISEYRANVKIAFKVNE